MHARSLQISYDTPEGETDPQPAVLVERWDRGQVRLVSRHDARNAAFIPARAQTCALRGPRPTVCLPGELPVRVTACPSDVDVSSIAPLCMTDVHDDHAVCVRVCVYTSIPLALPEHAGVG